MTPRKKIIITIICTALIVTILRETGVINIDYYKMSSETSLSSRWTDNSVTATIDSSTMRTKFVNSQYRELPVLVLDGSDTLFQDTERKNNSITITIDTLENGFLWTPIYKSVKFTVTGTSFFKNDLTKTPLAKISLVKANLTGRLKIKGTITIIGICSHKKAINLLKEVVVKNFVSETKRYFFLLD